MPVVRRRPTLAAVLVAMVLAGCGGGDPLPAGALDPAPGSVRVTAVEPAGLDGDTWYTRDASVLVRGEGPPGAMVEALRQDDGSLAASGRAGDDGRFALDGLPVSAGRPAFEVQAREAGRAPGPATALRIVRRVSPPEPFVVDATPEATNAREVTIAGSVESAVSAVLRVEGGSVPVEARKPAGEGRFTLEVPLDRDRVHRLVVTATDPAGNQAGPVERHVVQDATSPPPPSAPTRIVATERATLTGQAPEAVAVELATPADGTLALAVGGDGSFAAEVGLPGEGENRFQAIASDAAGNRSPPATLVLVRDTRAPPAPEVSVEAGNAVNGTIVVPSRTVSLVGRAEPGAAVETSGPSLFGLATAGADGAFQVTVRLPWGFFPVTISVEAVDAAGNRSEATRLSVASSSFEASEGGHR